MISNAGQIWTEEKFHGVVGERVNEKEMRPLKRGGTGSLSEHEAQPDFLPDAFESGTLNTVGLAGLAVGVRWVMERGVEGIRAREVALTQELIAGLREIPSADSGQVPAVTVYGTLDAELQTATVSFNIAGMAPSEVGLRLDEEYGIMCRVGLHCAPAAHKTIGTFPDGTVRFGLSTFSTREEVEAALVAVGELARETH